MGDFMGLVVIPNSDDDQPVMQAYRGRFLAAAGRYLDTGAADEIAAWLSFAEPAELRADRAARLRSRQAELLIAAQEIGSIAGALEKDLP